MYGLDWEVFKHGPSLGDGTLDPNHTVTREAEPKASSGGDFCPHPGDAVHRVGPAERGPREAHLVVGVELLVLTLALPQGLPLGLQSLGQVGILQALLRVLLREDLQFTLHRLQLLPGKRAPLTPLATPWAQRPLHEPKGQWDTTRRGRHEHPVPCHSCRSAARPRGSVHPLGV